MQAGYRHCACRDCFETIVGEPGEYCEECIEAGCPDHQGVEGMSQECQRKDAYHDCESVSTPDGTGTYCRICGTTLS